MTSDKFKEFLAKKLADASTAWSEKPTGIFDAQKCLKIIEEICVELERGTETDMIKENIDQKNKHFFYQNGCPETPRPEDQIVLLEREIKKLRAQVSVGAVRTHRAIQEAKANEGNAAELVALMENLVREEFVHGHDIGQDIAMSTMRGKITGVVKELNDVVRSVRASNHPMTHSEIALRKLISSLDSI